jgi:hypothetical protein
VGRNQHGPNQPHHSLLTLTTFLPMVLFLGVKAGEVLEIEWPINTSIQCFQVLVTSRERIQRCNKSKEWGGSFFSYVCGTGILKLGFVRQVLYDLSHTPNPFKLIFWIESWIFAPWPACDPPT